MRKLATALLTLLLVSTSWAQTADFFQDYIVVDRGSGNEYLAGTRNPDSAPTFSSGLGSFTSSSTLVIRGGEVKSYKNSGGDVTGAALFYRVYKSGDAPGGYSSIALPYDSELGGGDQKWDELAANVNLIPLTTSAGTWNVDVYWEVYTNLGTRTDGTAGSPVTTSYTADASLPVELVSFSGLGTTSGARLAWTTASETNNAGFYVEQQAGSAWTTVSGLVAGRGTTTERADYAYTVDDLTAGTYTFRLRQVDTDGSVRYSPNATVEVGVDGAARLTLLGQRAVRIETNDASAMTLRVVDVLGRVVATRRVSVDGTVVVELPGLAAGAYVVRVDGDRFAATKTLVVR